MSYGESTLFDCARNERPKVRIAHQAQSPRCGLEQD